MFDDWEYECQARFLYSALVAGKRADFADAKIKTILPPSSLGLLPFAYLRKVEEETGIRSFLEQRRCGAYTRLTKCFHHVAFSTLDMRNVTVAELETIPGIGPKTARFFVQWTRPDEEELAILDTHILAWLRENGYPEAPRSTPQGGKYAFWAEVFTKEAHDRKLTVREFDILIWEARAKRKTQDNTTIPKEAV